METRYYVYTEVICDFCGEDYTLSDAVGGILIGSYAVCPECAKKCKEADERAEEGQTFFDFVRQVRHKMLTGYYARRTQE